MTQEAMDYFNEALDYIQGNSIKREQIDWQALRKEVFALVEKAQTPAETYPVIRMILERLGDNHSFFRDPEEERILKAGMAHNFGLVVVYPEGIIVIIFPGSPAEKSGLRVGDRIVQINGQPIGILTPKDRRMAFRADWLDLAVIPAGQEITRSVQLQSVLYSVAPLPQGQRITPSIGYLELPGIMNSPENTQAYAQKAQQIIREMDQIALSGWIIDLRRNTGGNMYPMVAGVGPILGEGECISFVSSQGKKRVFYQNGQALIEPAQVIVKVDNPYQLKNPNPPVAVLTSSLTVSSGEFVALAFCGRPRTHSFGEPTFGLPTANELPDGAMVILTGALGADRMGCIYDSPLLPDHPVKTDWTQIGTIDDPVLQSAVQWLQEEEGCQESSDLGE